MSGDMWNAVGAIASLLALLLSFTLEWRRISKVLHSVRTRTKDVFSGFKEAGLAIARRAWQALFVILTIWLFVTWSQDNIVIFFRRPPATWSWDQFIFSVLVSGFVLISLYILLINPRMEISRKEYFIKTMTEQKFEFPKVAAVFFDESLPTSFVDAPHKAAEYFVSHGFIRVDSIELKILMEEYILRGEAHKTIFVFVNDIAPLSVVQVTHPSCTLRRYLDAGGRVVWWGDIPLHVKGLPNQMKEEVMAGPIVLSVDHYIPLRRNESGNIMPVLWSRSDLDDRIQLTDAGRAIGLKTLGRCIRPAGVDRDTIVFSEICGDLGFGERFKDFRWANSYRKVYNKNYPHSGFMQYPTMGVSGNDTATLEEFFRFAVSDWPFVTPG